MMWTDDPVRDAERHEMSRPKIIGYCPFCMEQILANEEWIPGKGKNRAHRECAQKALEELEEYLKHL